MKYALSSYLVKYIFVTTGKARSEFGVLALLGICARTPAAWGKPNQARTASLPAPGFAHHPVGPHT